MAFGLSESMLALVISRSCCGAVREPGPGTLVDKRSLAYLTVEWQCRSPEGYVGRIDRRNQ